MIYRTFFLHLPTHLTWRNMVSKTECKFCALKSAAAERLSTEELDFMHSSCAEVQFLAGEVILVQNTPSATVAYIKAGLVKIHVNGPVKERIVKIVKAPAHLCMSSTLDDAVNHFSATALEPTSVCFINVATFKNFICQNGDFAYHIVKELCKGEIDGFLGLVNNEQKHSVGKIAEAILFFAKEIYNDKTFVLPISRQELGDYLGVTRERICRTLTDFHNEEILEVDGRKISIVNEALLKQISDKG